LACLLTIDGDTDACDQKNALHWEQVDPPWVLPNYISELVWALQEMKAWIATSGVAASAAVVTDVPAPPIHASHGESKVGVSDEELPTLQKVLSKVWWAEDIKHVLDKGVWAAMPAMHQGWQSLIQVICLCFLPSFQLILE